MVDIVSFDYFEPFEYIDAGFTEVWAYSPEFEWLEYDTVNFVLGMGSIIVFAALEILLLLVSLMVKPCLHRCPCKWVRENLSTAKIWDNSLTFIHGTFFSIMICSAVSKSMAEYYDEFETVD